MLLVALTLSLLAPAPWSTAELLVVANKADNTITLIEVASGTTLATLPTGLGPHEVAVTRDGRWAVSTNYGAQTPGNSLTVFDLQRRTVERTIDLGEFRRPHGAVFLPDGRLLVTSEANQALLAVDIVRGVVLGHVPTNARGSHMVAVRADGQRAYTANIPDGSITEIDLDRMEPLRTLPVSKMTEAVAVTADGKQVWVGSNTEGSVSIVDVSRWATTATLEGMGFPYRVNGSAASDVMVVSNPRADSAYIVDIATRTRRAAVFTGAGTQPVGGVLSSDGRRAFLALQGTNQVVEIDLESARVRRYFEVGARPDGVAVTSP